MDDLGTGLPMPLLLSSKSLLLSLTLVYLLTLVLTLSLYSILKDRRPGFNVAQLGMRESGSCQTDRYYHDYEVAVISSGTPAMPFYVQGLS